MKKGFLVLILAIFTVFTVSSQYITPHEFALTSQTGYSMVNGMIGVEAQMDHVALSVGYFPYDFSSFSNMLNTGSTSIAVSYYHGGVEELGSGVFNSGLYATIGLATRTYETFDIYHENPLPMGLLTTGFRVLIGGYGYGKVGIGVGYNSRGFVPSGEATFGFMLTWY